MGVIRAHVRRKPTFPNPDHEARLYHSAIMLSLQVPLYELVSEKATKRTARLNPFSTFALWRPHDHRGLRASENKNLMGRQCDPDKGVWFGGIATGYVLKCPCGAAVLEQVTLFTEIARLMRNE